MARLSNNSDCDFLASPGEDFADIAKLFAYQPPELNEFFADPIVQMRIAKIIARAMDTPTKPQGRGRSRHTSIRQ
jgi:hypothetical protein